MNYKFFLPLVLIILGAVACKKESEELKTAKPEKKINTSLVQLVQKLHLYADTVYILDNQLLRTNGQELIVDAGTVIKCSGVGNSPGIFITQGALISLNGMREKPVVFTSNSPTGTQKAGDWGGIVIEGKSFNNNISPSVSGIDDSSGALNFVRIEFAGLTLRGVGSKTKIRNVQVSYAGGRASFKFEGGTFYATNLVSFASNAAADYYITNGCNARLQNIVSYRHPFFANGSSNDLLCGMLIENNEFDNARVLPQTNPLITNATITATGNRQEALSKYRDSAFRNAALITTGNAKFKIRNSVFAGFPAAVWYVDDNRTAASLNHSYAEVAYSFFHSGTTRNFYLLPGVYGSATSVDFRVFMLQDTLKNKLLSTVNELGFTDFIQYNSPVLIPKSGSSLLSGADFSKVEFNDSFFNKVNYAGALGTDNWLQGWVNFEPLQTDYNVIK